MGVLGLLCEVLFTFCFCHLFAALSFTQEPNLSTHPLYVHTYSYSLSWPFVSCFTLKMHKYHTLIPLDFFQARVRYHYRCIKPLDLQNPHPNIEERHRGAANFASAVISLPFSLSQKVPGNAAAQLYQNYLLRPKSNWVLYAFAHFYFKYPPQKKVKFKFFFKVRHNSFHAAITQARCPIYGFPSVRIQLFTSVYLFSFDKYLDTHSR